MEVSIREMRPNEYHYPEEWKKLEGWTLLDSQYWKMITTKFPIVKTNLVAVDGKSTKFAKPRWEKYKKLKLLADEPVGFLSWIRLKPKFCFVQLCIVRKDLQRQGIGTKLGQKMFEMIEPDCNMGLDAGVHFVDFSRKRGLYTCILICLQMMNFLKITKSDLDLW